MNFLPGKRYPMRDGGVATLERRDPYNANMWFGGYTTPRSKQGWWDEDGRYTKGAEHPTDIISDIPLPDDAPALTAEELTLAVDALFAFGSACAGPMLQKARALADKLSAMAKVSP